MHFKIFSDLPDVCTQMTSQVEYMLLLNSSWGSEEFQLRASLWLLKTALATVLACSVR